MSDAFANALALRRRGASSSQAVIKEVTGTTDNRAITVAKASNATPTNKFTGKDAKALANAVEKETGDKLTNNGARALVKAGQADEVLIQKLMQVPGALTTAKVDEARARTDRMLEMKAALSRKYIGVVYDAQMEKAKEAEKLCPSPFPPVKIEEAVTPPPS